jgi:hypothetical protein
MESCTRVLLLPPPTIVCRMAFPFAPRAKVNVALFSEFIRFGDVEMEKLNEKKS